MIENVRFALRQLRRNPAFAALAIVTLALGIGANTAMFTVIDGVLLRPLPYPDGDRIMAITTGPASQGNQVQPTSWLNYAELREQARQFRTVAAYAIDFSVVRSTQESEAVLAIKATASLFDVLGVQAKLGRVLVDSDNQPGAPNVVVLSSGIWRGQFGSDPHIVGQQVHIGDVPYTIVGVLPENLHFAGNDATSGVWIAYQPDPNSLTDRSVNFLYVLGSLQPGISRQAAQSEVTSISHGIVQKDPEHAKDLAFRLVPFRDVLTAQVRPVFLALTGALILVLLIACANVANLQLARCLARNQELAVRTALGASRRGLLVQMLVEGGVLSLFGAIAGVGLAQLMLAGIHRLPPDVIPRAEEIHLRLNVFLMLLLATAVTTLLSSILPAVVAMHSDPQGVLQEGSRGASPSRRRSHMSSVMVMGEVAISVVLLISGGLMFRTLYNLQHIQLGFEETNLTTFTALPGSAGGFWAIKNPETASQQDSIALRLYAPMEERIRHLPGVMDAAFTNVIPFQAIVMNTSFGIVGRPQMAEEANGSQALIHAVSGGYARVMKTPVLQGRALSDEDTARSLYVATINETMAKQYFAGQNPIGQQIDLAGNTPKDRAESGMLQPYVIVGVMADVVQNQIAQPVAPEIYLTYPQIPVKSFFYQILVTPETNYVLRTHGPVETTSMVRDAFHQWAPDFAVNNFQTMQDAHDDADFNQRLGLYLVVAFAGIAIIMVLAGLYGVLSHLVGQRQREIAIRIALGADRPTVLALILRRGLVLTAIGLAIGIAASAGVEQWLRSFLYQVSPTDAITYGVVVIILLFVGFAAALIPARRAAWIEPTNALRGE